MIEILRLSEIPSFPFHLKTIQSSQNLTKFSNSFCFLSAVVQLYGRCFGNSTAAFVGDHDKYRKRTPPPRPEWCFCNGWRDVCDQHRGREECEVPHYPNKFDPDTQFCRRGDHNHCKSKDINMFCSNTLLQDPKDGLQKNLCECANDMTFDTK